MDLIQKIIDFVLELIGIKQKAPPQLPAAPSRAPDPSPRTSAIPGSEHIEGAENMQVRNVSESDPGYRLIKRSDGAELVEIDGEQSWANRINREVPREAWQDVWGPLARVPDAQRLEEFCLHSRQFDELQSQPLEAEKKLLALGYKSVGEYFRVQATIHKYKGTPHGPNVEDCIIDSQEYVSAMMRADARLRDQNHAAVAAANPAMMAPVDGVTVEMYAKIAARVAQGIAQPDLMKLLASMNLDFSAWDRANKVWSDRMSKDTSGTIAGVYSKAFMNSGQGQFGGASQATAAMNFNGSAAGGGEPMPFDRCCEIQGAMSAWAKSGQDVNALLKKHFNMTASDFAAAHTWWLSQLTANIARFDEYTKKCAAYEAKYADAGAGKNDSDIEF